MGTSQQVGFHYYSQTVEVPQQQTIWGRLMGLVGGYGHACGDVQKLLVKDLGCRISGWIRRLYTQKCYKSLGLQGLGFRIGAMLRTVTSVFVRINVVPVAFNQTWIGGPTQICFGPNT